MRTADSGKEPIPAERTSHAEGLILRAVTKAVKTFRLYLEDFLGYFTYGIIKALSEGLNSRI